MKVLVTEFMDDTALTGFGPEYSVACDPALAEDREALLRAVADVRALIVRNRTRVDGALLASAPLLKVVGRLGTGLDNIDLDACRARSVAVRPASGANAQSVAEYVVAATLMLLRGAFRADAALIAGHWPRAECIGGEVAGRTMGLWGYGAIARQVAAWARCMGMEVIAHDPFLDREDPAWQEAEPCDAATLLSRADVLSLHVPLTAATRHMIDRAAIAQMRPGAVLINTARGGIVDEAALVAALRSGALGGAALDVFETEPLDAEAGHLFAGVPNLYLTPHIAGVTHEANARVSRLTVRNVMEELAAHGGS